MLELEAELRSRIEEVAARCRELPLGGWLKKDYRFQRADASGTVREVRFAELFGERRMTRDRRGERPVPQQNYEHRYFTEHVMGGAS